MQDFFWQVRLVRRYSVTYGSAPTVKMLFLSWAALSLFSLSGCAASAAADDDGGELLDGATYDAGKHDGNTQDTGSQGQCVTNCTSDLDCQNSCPAVTNMGVNCCDVATGFCYAYAQSSCPAPVADASLD